MHHPASQPEENEQPSGNGEHVRARSMSLKAWDACWRHTVIWHGKLTDVSGFSLPEGALDALRKSRRRASRAERMELDDIIMTLHEVFREAYLHVIHRKEGEEKDYRGQPVMDESLSEKFGRLVKNHSSRRVLSGRKAEQSRRKN